MQKNVNQLYKRVANLKTKHNNIIIYYFNFMKDFHKIKDILGIVAGIMILFLIIAFVILFIRC